MSKLQYKKDSHFTIIWNLIFVNINSFKEENRSDDTLRTSRLHTFRKKVSSIFKQETFIIMLSVTRLIFF